MDVRPFSTASLTPVIPFHALVTRIMQIMIYISDYKKWFNFLFSELRYPQHLPHIFRGLR